MPEPVNMGELLLQRIADSLDEIKDALGREHAPVKPPAPAAAPPVKKAASKRSRTEVTGR